MKTPAKILWYVSTDNPKRSEKAIRAYSSLIETQIGRPKSIFKQFERFGVYAWPDLLEMVQGDLAAEVMALRFYGTENFTRPMPFQKIQEVLARHTKKNQLQSPLKISRACFEEICLYCSEMPFHEAPRDSTVGQTGVRTSPHGGQQND